LLKLLLVEDGSGVADQLWSDADALTTCRLTFVEASAGIARATRARRIRARQAARPKAELCRRWHELDVVELDEELAEVAGEAAAFYGLRAGEAVQLAAALRVVDRTLVFASWDARLRDAAASAGLAVAP